MCGWQQAAHTVWEWLIGVGSSDLSDTGPSVDRFGTSNMTYLYASGTDISEGAKAILTSPVMSQRAYICWMLTFWYNMFGSGIGSLNVYQTPINGSISEGLRIFNMNGQQTNSTTWLQAEIMLPDTPPEFRIVIEAVRGTDSSSNIAIDDVALRPDNNMVLVASPDPPRIYVAPTDTFNFTLIHIPELEAKAQRTYDVDYDPEDGMVYWADFVSISRAFLNGSGVEVVVSDGGTTEMSQVSRTERPVEGSSSTNQPISPDSTATPTAISMKSSFRGTTGMSQVSTTERPVEGTTEMTQVSTTERPVEGL
ncbi:neuropilin-1a-like [Patiria miniata]|uniref:MAM domain-containing protein n=1 Tax=Patiria miniata TaxID=46514 RepID=A0A914AMJ7_PATMI|nr:neuropilin-1a-like [Patiria miniata]